MTYAIAGLTAGLASMVQVGRLTGASPQADPTLLLTVIAAVLIGGTAITGGEGGVLGTLIGVLFLGVVQNGLTLSGVSSFWQGTVSGVILIAAVGLGVLRRRGLRAAEAIRIDGMKRWAAIAALVAASAFAGCGGGGRSEGGSTKIAYSNPVGAQPGQQDIVFGFEAGAAELGWKAESIDANLSPDKQVADIATMVTQGQDGIASWTLDPGAAAGAYGQAKAAGIPVVGVNSEGTGIDATVWWEINLCGAGSPIAKLAEYIAAERPGAKVLAIGGPPVPSIQAYERCFAENAEQRRASRSSARRTTRRTPPPPRSRSSPTC